MIRSERKLSYISTLILVLCGVLASIPAMAITVTQSPLIATLDNGYIGLGIGKKDTVFEPANVGKGYLRADAATHSVGTGTPPVSGRFYMWTTGGDPTTSEDDNQALIYTPLTIPNIALPVGRVATWQIMTDDGLGDWASYTTGGNAAVWGDQSDGTWSQDLVADTTTNEITGVFEPGFVATTSSGTTTTAAASDSTTTTTTTVVSSKIKCALNAKMLRDTVRWKWTITNTDTVTRMVGLRLCIDEMLEPNDLGTKNSENVVSIGAGGLISKPTVLSDSYIPSQVELFNSATSPVMSFREIFSGQGATVPNKVGIDEWSNLTDLGETTDPTDPSISIGNQWSYGVDPITGGMNSWLYATPVADSISTDLATGAFWQAVPVGPGASITIIHYTGLACASSNFTTPSIDHTRYVGATQSPRTLKYYTNNGVGQLYPATFNITAYVNNVGTKPGLEDLTNVSATLVLPDGLQLASSENGKYTKVMSAVAVGEEQSVTWSVVPSSSVTGNVKYFVTFNADPVGGSSVSREIYFPATEKQPIESGWQMVTVPFKITTLDPIDALGLNGYASGMWQWNASTSSYDAVANPVPGQGYWLKMDLAKSTSISSSHSAVDCTSKSGYTISLNKGWNMIGDPFLYSTTIGQSKIYDSSTGDVVDYETAVTEGLISTYTWYWNSASGKYDLWNDSRAPLDPWKGYWVKVLQPGLKMIFSPVSQIGAQLGVLSDDGSIPPPPSAP